jgi:hypothetical protein
MREEMVIVQPVMAFAQYDQVVEGEDTEELLTPPEFPTANKRAKMNHEEKAREEPDQEVENEHAEWTIALLSLIKGKRKLESLVRSVSHLASFIINPMINDRNFKFSIKYSLTYIPSAKRSNPRLSSRKPCIGSHSSPQGTFLDRTPWD